MSTQSPNIIQTADLLWKHDKLGNEAPYSKQFDDVYYSMQDGLAESHYVFAEQNALPERFAALFNQCLYKNNDQFSDAADTVKSSTTTPDPTQQVNNQKLSSTPRIAPSEIPTSPTLSKTNQTFTIGELGFGTGLNILMVWQLWEKTKQEYLTKKPINPDSSISPRLHLISTEKFPLTHSDLKRSLMSWQQYDSELTPYIEQLLHLYPPSVAGCHRLHLAPDVTLDIWLGDAMHSLTKMTINNVRSSIAKPLSFDAGIDAWFLDGFAPACNDSLWELQIFEQLYRLSKPNATFATFSCAGVVKRGLTQAGFAIKKVAGFGRKRHMLTGRKPSTTSNVAINDTNEALMHTINTNERIVVIGAGVSGLMATWSLLQRGYKITLIDETAPLAGASGNPRALLAPKMTPVAHVSEHLHSIGYLYSQRLYRQFDDAIAKKKTDDTAKKGRLFTRTGTIDLLLKANVTADQIDQYPDDMATILTATQAAQLLQAKLTSALPDANLYLPQAGLVNPALLAKHVLTHPNLQFVKAKVIKIKQDKSQVTLTYAKNEENAPAQTAPSCPASFISDAFDKVVIAAAYRSHSLDSRIFDYRKIRGQLSWFVPTQKQLQLLPKLPLKYGGYCARFVPEDDETLNPIKANIPTFLLGASFVRNDITVDLRQDEHKINRDKLVTAIPQLQTLFDCNKSMDSIETAATDVSQWQGRVGIRAQTPDYHPVVGALDTTEQVWTISGMGSKGFAFAPLCAEVLADLMTKQIPPLPNTLLTRLSPQRQRLQTPLNSVHVNK